MKEHRKIGVGIKFFWAEVEAAEMAADAGDCKDGKHTFSVYCALCILEHHASTNNKSHFTASLEEISGVCRLGVTTVKKALKLLRKSGLLTVEPGGLPLRSNIFTLHLVNTEQGRDATSSEAQDGSNRGAARLQQSRTATTRPKEKKRSSASPFSQKVKGGASAGTPSASAEGSCSAPKKIAQSFVGTF